MSSAKTTSSKAISSSALKDEDRHWNDRARQLEHAKKKLHEGWRNDPEVLKQYFEACVNNWKVYKGERTPKQILKLQSIYKQALYGDNPEPPPEQLDSPEGEKWKSWSVLRGTPQDVAKRRFITYLAEINPLLIDVMPDEKPPVGFPLDRRGNPICAKCNTVVGCTRPITDQYKMNLRLQLLENEEFHEPDKLKIWIRNALQHQRCVWGVHTPITKVESRPFVDWFNRNENRGFYAYDSMPLMRIVRELVQHYHEVVYDLMQHKHEVEPEVYNETASKNLKIKEIFEEFSGEKYVFELPCTRDSDNCNQRRLADNGKNHMHEVELDPPTVSDLNTMEEAISLRVQCQKLGINPSTGVVKNIAERCEIYRQRIAEHFEALKKSAEAKARNDSRAAIHKEEKKKVFGLSKEMLQRQCWEACNLNLVDNVITIVKRGCNANEESVRGLTPLLCMVLNEAVVEKVELLLSYKADINMTNKFGFTPLMMACRLKDLKMVHVLMRNGASALQKGYKGQNALHICIIHGSDEIVKVIVEYLKESVGDAMRVVRFIDAVDEEGETAMIIAAKIRNGIMCYLLAQLGANPNLRNRVGRTAAYLARSKGWSEVADWLEKKVGAGASKIETYSDVQFEKQARIGNIKIKEALQRFGKQYLMLIQNRFSQHPLGCPLLAQMLIEDKGERARSEQQDFVDNHQRYIFKRYPEDYGLKPKRSLLSEGLPIVDRAAADAAIAQMKESLKEMLTLIGAGFTYPDTEIPSQPLPWTPLMCAVACNDMRSTKLLIREGASPNHPNKDGMTAVMLAAQLQHIEILIELLHQGGDLAAVDNHGFTALGYAGALPIPTVMGRDLVGVLLEDDISGPRLLDSTQVIKIAISNGLSDLKDLVAKNHEEARVDQIKEHKKILQLLHQYGLTPINNTYNLHHQVRTGQWRVGKSSKNQDDLEFTGGDDESSETSSIVNIYEEEARKRFEDEQALLREGLDEEDDPNLLRCPICTLPIPCSHFFKAQTLLNYLKRNESEKSRNTGGGSEGHNDEVGSIPSSSSSSRPFKKMRVKTRAQEILEETRLDDRSTDRSKTFATIYQDREVKLEKAWQKLTKEYDESLLLERQEQQEKEELDEFYDSKREEVLNDSLEAYFNKKSQASASVSGSPLPIIQHQSTGAEDFPSRPSSIESFSSSTSGTFSGTVSPSKRSIRFADMASSADTSAVSTPSTSSMLATIDEYAPLDSASAHVNVPLAIEGATIEDHEQWSLQPLPDMRSFTPISILKPVSKDVSAGNSRSSKRVKFINIPDNGPDEQSGGGTMELESLVDVQATRDSERAFLDAMTLLRGEAEQNFNKEDEQLVKLDDNLGKNRRIVLFTKERIGTPVDDGFTSPLKSTKPTIPKRAPKTPKKRITRKEIVSTKIEISGWIFSHLAALQSNILPLESISLSQKAWVSILEHLNNKLMDQWLDIMDIHLLIDVKTWENTAPRCCLCSIGFVRNKASLEFYRADRQKYIVKSREAYNALLENNDGHSESTLPKSAKYVSAEFDKFICLQCLMRKELFEKITQSLPRSFRKTLTLKWPLVVMEKLPLPIAPVIEQASAEMHEPFPIQQQALSTLSNSIDMMRLNSPPRSPTLHPSSPQLPFTNPMGTIGTPLNLATNSTTIMTLEQLSNYMAPMESTFQSPIASMKLKQLDFMESMTLNTSPQKIVFDDDEVSLPSISGISLTSSQDASTASIPSTISMVDPLKKPKEMALLPYLIAKGHFEEAERVVRITLGKQAVDEGEGMYLLLKILALQADMYKMMGLWPLAMAIYVDVTELTSSLLGLSDNVTFKALTLVSSCFRKMQKPKLADEYMKHCIDQLGYNLKKSAKDDMIERLQKLNSTSVKKFIKNNRIWVEYLYPEVLKRANHKIRLQYFEFLGLGGFYSLLTDQRASMVIARRAFFGFCDSFFDPDEEQDLIAYAKFLDYAFRLRVADDDEVYRYFIQRIIQKYLAKNLVVKLDIAKKFRQLTSQNKIEAILDFLHNGTPLDMEVFDEILYFTLKQLCSTYQYFLIHSQSGVILRECAQDIANTACHVAVTMIQCIFRRNHARLIVKARKSERAARLEALRRLEEEQEEEQDDESDSGGK